MTSPDLLSSQQAIAVAALTAVSRSLPDYRRLSDDALLDMARSIAHQRQLVDAATALVGGEIARRSAHFLGSGGLAQRTGHRTATDLLKFTTGLSGREAALAVRVGQLAQEPALPLSSSADPVVDVDLPADARADRPWLKAVAGAMEAGTILAGQADAIQVGLGEPTVAVTADLLTSAVQVLLDDVASGLDTDGLWRRARRLRDEIDAAGIAEREETRRSARSLRFVRLPGGMSRLIWVMDPETAAAVGNLFDRATSPRRGGPRFVDGPAGRQRSADSHDRDSHDRNSHDRDSRDRYAHHSGSQYGGSRHGGSRQGAAARGFPAGSAPDVELARRIAQDARTTEQLASDVFSDLLRAGSSVDSTQLIGSGAPVVKLLVLKSSVGPLSAGSLDSDADADADAGAGAGAGAPARAPARAQAHDRCSEKSDQPGHGYIEGQSDPVSIGTIRRAICTGVIEPLLFDTSGAALDVGREQRFFSSKQRRILAARDGGCLFPDCDRPPAWCEGHHVQHVHRDGGRSETGNGILLCRHHHLLVHNNEWEIENRADQYWLVPPVSVDSTQTPIRLKTKSAAHRDLVSSAG